MMWDPCCLQIHPTTSAKFLLQCSQALVISTWTSWGSLFSQSCLVSSSSDFGLSHQGSIFVAEILPSHRPCPSRDTLRSNFAVLVETTQVASLPDSFLNDSGLFPKTPLEALPSQMSSWVSRAYLITQFLSLYNTSVVSVPNTSLWVINSTRRGCFCGYKEDAWVKISCWQVNPTLYSLKFFFFFLDSSMCFTWFSSKDISWKLKLEHALSAGVQMGWHLVACPSWISPCTYRAVSHYTSGRFFSREFGSEDLQQSCLRSIINSP